MSDPVIELKGLKKDYGNGRGVFDVSFSVERGEVFGFLGPNGAGKTVTMRNLMGFIRPDEGTVSIDGLNCFSQRSRIQERLGYLPGEIACMDEMTGAAFLEFMARMKKLRDRTRMNQLVEYFELDPARRIRKMSKGTKQKVGLVCAFMTSPDIVLLDEPTSGLDPHPAFVAPVRRSGAHVRPRRIHPCGQAGRRRAHGRRAEEPQARVRGDVRRRDHARPLRAGASRRTETGRG